MKKKIALLTPLALLSLSACSLNGEEKLTCTNEREVGNTTTNIKYEINHKNNDIKKMTIIYDYNNTSNTAKTKIDGTDADTDGITETKEDVNDDLSDKVIDGVVGDTVDTILGPITDTIIDLSKVKERHNSVQTNYKDVEGFTYTVDNDEDNHYKIKYEVDFDKISSTDLTRLGYTKDLEKARSDYESQGFTCK